MHWNLPLSTATTTIMATSTTDLSPKSIHCSTAVEKANFMLEAIRKGNGNKICNVPIQSCP